MIDMVRNPFFIRAAEQAASDADFISLFESRVLEKLPRSGQLWDRPLVLRSSPGGGKTSVLRLFTAGVLTEVLRRPDTEELIRRLRELGAVETRNPRILGVLLPLGRDYPELDHLELRDIEKELVFRALLNARVLLAVLQNAIKLVDLSFPEDLSRLQFHYREPLKPWIPRQLCSNRGDEAYLQCRTLEAQVLDLLDNLYTRIPSSVPHHVRLWVLDLLSSVEIRFRGEALPRPLLMFDDAHLLSARQREILFEELWSRELRIARWVAERNQVLDLDDLLRTNSPLNGSKPGRDYTEVLLERIPKRAFRQIVLGIANRRCAIAAQTSNVPREFSTMVRTSPTEGRSIGPAGMHRLQSRLQELGRNLPGIRSLAESFTSHALSEYEEAVHLRLAAILARRHVSGRQLALEFFPVSGPKSGDLKAAELFLTRENGLPYYYGLNQIVTLASGNIEQFLYVAGNLFGEVTVRSSLGQKAALSAQRQDELIRQVARQMLENLPKMMRFGRNVFNLVNAMGEYCCRVTYDPAASYSPGVSGVAIEWKDYLQLRETSSESYRLFLSALSSALAHRVLIARPRLKCKNKYWLVLYLNRLLCVSFNLPTQYGGFREKHPDTLVAWALGESQGWEERLL